VQKRRKPGKLGKRLVSIQDFLYLIEGSRAVTLTLLCQQPALWGHCLRGSPRLRSAIENIFSGRLARSSRAQRAAPLIPIRFRGWQTQKMNTATAPSYASQQPRVRVLVADDHEVMRLGVRNLLEIHPGWSVCAEASNGQEAVEKTFQFHPDVIIMDITMPVMNGIEAANRITRTQPRIPVILFSLHVSEDLYPHFQTDGIRGAVAKGHAARDLVQAVEAVLGGGTFFPDRKTAFS